MKQFISTVLAFLISVFGFFLTPSPAADLEPVAAREGTLTVTEEILLTTLVDTELAWLASLQLENGALPMTKNNNGDVTVNPYFADITAMALLDKPQQYAQCVKAYLVWHFEHLNTKQSDPNNLDATIFDYTVTLENGKIVKETAKNSYDSVDSYAATFLTTLAKYYARTGDSEFIIAHADDINRVTKTMLSTMFLGLSMASPSYEIKYLMDNCEVYEGLTAVTALYEEVLAQHSSACEGMLRKCDLAFTQLCNAMENVMWDADSVKQHRNSHGTASIRVPPHSFSRFSAVSLRPKPNAQITCTTRSAIPMHGKTLKFRANSAGVRMCSQQQK